LERITFNNNREVTNVEALRSLFPIKNGGIFDRTSIREGLDNLRKAYLALGHLNFNSIPNTTIDEGSQTISLDIDIGSYIQFSLRATVRESSPILFIQRFWPLMACESTLLNSAVTTSPSLQWQLRAEKRSQFGHHLTMQCS
jgi:hypothetical protein